MRYLTGGRLVLVSILALGIAAAPAAAQQNRNSDNLGNLISNLFAETVVLDNDFHEAHFQGPGLDLINAGLSQALATQLSSYPVASSSGGFSYEYNPTTGAFTRASESFGPIFAERAETSGKGRWNFGFSYLQAEYDELDGLGLDNGEFEFQLQHVDNENDGLLNPHFQGDIIGVQTRIQVESEIAVAFFNFGATQNLDLGIAVPFVSVDLEAQADLSINRLATRGDQTTHRFPESVATNEARTTARAVSSDDASGLGDVLLRGKYRFGETSPWALGAEVRLPTGDEEDLLGTGFTQTKVFLIGSTTWGQSFSPHLNVGYTFSSGSSDLIDDLPDEINYTLGFDIAFGPRVTFAADVIGRLLQDAQTVVARDEEFVFCADEFFDCSGANPVVDSARARNLEFVEDDVNLLLGAAGFKFNIAGQFLLTANVIFPLNDEGLKIDGVVPTIGVDWSF